VILQNIKIQKERNDTKTDINPEKIGMTLQLLVLSQNTYFGINLLFVQA
jgi:hypothetical protein